jgi:hypothetical protein
MPPNKFQSNYSKRPVRKVRLLRLAPRRSKSLLEEYFYGIAAAICVVVMILGKAGGMSGYNAVVSALWVGAFLWFAWQVWGYRQEQAKAGSREKAKQAVQAPTQMMNQPLPPNMKPMIGPQWPLKTLPGTTRAWPTQRVVRPAPQESKKAAPASTPAPASDGPAPAAPGNPNKPAFVYQRPTLPDRKPKLPANWAGQQDKKPKR